MRGDDAQSCYGLKTNQETENRVGMYSSSQPRGECLYTAVPEQALFAPNCIHCSPACLQIKGKTNQSTPSNLSSFFFHWDWVYGDVLVQGIQCVTVFSLTIYLEERSYKEIPALAQSFFFHLKPADGNQRAAFSSEVASFSAEAAVFTGCGQHARCSPA